MKEIATALLKAQSEMSNPVKGSSNPYFKSRYADLNAVREAVIPVLNQHGITVIQPMVSIDGKNYIKTVLLHESGETIESITEIIYAKTNDAQAQGSGITYARRYGLQSLVCVGAEDDDGNKASAPERKAPERKAPDKEDINTELKQALDALGKCNDIISVMEVWNTFDNLQTNEKFKTECTKARKRIENATKK